MNILFIGAPGSGKGTQSRLLINSYRFIQLSTGDLLRAEITSGSVLGKEAKHLMDQGLLVPDDLMLKIVADFVSQNSDKSIIFDGYPRTIRQADLLDSVLSGMRMKLDAIIYFKVNNESLINRLAGRQTCSVCGEIYNSATKRPKQDKVCDICGGELKIRNDDRPEVIRERLNQYELNTAPVIGYYAGNPCFHEVDASEDESAIFNKLKKILEI